MTNQDSSGVQAQRRNKVKTLLTNSVRSTLHQMQGTLQLQNGLRRTGPVPGPPNAWWQHQFPSRHLTGGLLKSPNRGVWVKVFHHLRIDECS